MRAKPFQFSGSCDECGEHSEEPRAAVALISEDDADDDNDEFDSKGWICLKCATKLVGRLRAAVKACRAKVKRGLVYRDSRWRKPKRKASTKAPVGEASAKETP